MAKNRQIEFFYGDAIIDAIACGCTEVDSRERNFDHILTNFINGLRLRFFLSLKKFSKSEKLNFSDFGLNPIR